MPSIFIQNGTVINPESKNPEQVADVFIQNGKIRKIGKNLKAKADKTIDARGKIITAGLVDIHVHFREPGQESKETIETATRSAASGGFTTVVGMPNTNPLIDSKNAVNFILKRAKDTGVVNVLTTASLTKGSTGKELANLNELKKAGAVALIDDCPGNPSTVLQKKALKLCRKLNLPIMAHAENAEMKGEGVMHEGWISTQLGLPGIPVEVETSAVASIIKLLREVPTAYHFTHISTKGTVELIRQAKKEGLPVTCDVTPHHLALTDEACSNYNTLAKVAPPLRSEEHRQELLKGLADGTIDAIASDHAPHKSAEKFVPFAEAANGIIGLETTFPVLYTELVAKKILSLAEFIKKLTINPANVIQIKKGRLTVGEDADITIFDMKTKQKIDKNKFLSKGRNTPFHGKLCQGFATTTIMGGKIVYQD